MNDLFLKLIKNARREQAPQLDIADQVMAIIKNGKTAVNADISGRTFAWMAGLSTAAAIAVGTLAVLAYYTWTTPLSEVSETIAWAF